MNEHLSKKNAEIARGARIMKKQKKIKSTWTRNCRVLIRVEGDTPEDDKVLTVKHLADLDPYRE